MTAGFIVADGKTGGHRPPLQQPNGSLTAVFRFKDEWKLRPNLTLNAGLHYEWYGEEKGLTGYPVGGIGGLFGISGTGFDALWQPGLMKGYRLASSLSDETGREPAAHPVLHAT